MQHKKYVAMSKFIKEKYAALNEQIPKLISEGKTVREMSSILNVSKSAIDRRCRALNISVPNHHNSLKFNNTVFDSIDTEEKAYWLGFLYADGSVGSAESKIELGYHKNIK